MTTLKIRSDPMATWECAKQVQASSEVSASVTHARCILGTSRKTRIDRDDICMSINVRKPTTACQMSEFGAEMIACPWNQQVHLQFADSLVQKSSKLEIILPDSQDPRILEICKKVKGVEGPATGRFIHRCMEPVVLDNRPNCGDHY